MLVSLLCARASICYKDGSRDKQQVLKRDCSLLKRRSHYFICIATCLVIMLTQFVIYILIKATAATSSDAALFFFFNVY